MNFDYLRHILTTRLDERVESERTEITPAVTASDYEGYFKEVFAGAIL